MRERFKATPSTINASENTSTAEAALSAEQVALSRSRCTAIDASQFLFAGYASDLSDDEIEEIESGDEGDDENEDDESNGEDGDGQEIGVVQAAPTYQPSNIRPLKCQRLEVPRRVTRLKNREKKHSEFRTALSALDKLLISKKTTFEAGSRSLQECHTLAIQSHLMLIVKSKLGFAVASEQAAQSHGMAAVWGGRMLHSWTCAWISLKQLPTS